MISIARWVRPLAGFLFASALLGGAWTGANWFRQARADAELPLAPARKGEFVVIIRCRGDIKAGRSVPIYAPVVPNLTIAWMSPAGEPVKEGEPIIRFDSSSAQQQLVQKQAALKQAQATLDQALGQAQITAQKDQSDLADARYNVEKARLQTAGNEFVGRIQAEQARIDLGVAEQKLRVQEANMALHAASDKSKIASLTRQRDQAQADVDLTQSRIEQMEIRAPLTGFVVFVSNYNQGPLNARPFKVGDNVFAGMNLAEMPDMDSLVMDAKVEEIDRGRIAAGNDVRLRVDALPELSIEAKVTRISALAELGVEFPPTRNFRAYAALPNPDPRLRPGMNGGMDIVINRIPGAISVPAKALFTRAGRPIVYLADRGRYTPAEVQVLARNPDEVAISGVAAGVLVALADPEKTEARK
jgi:multidrug efflux pump subunit AcrA (membrane-fusion protein)